MTDFVQTMKDWKRMCNAMCQDNECTNIPDDIKVKAAMKCMKLGFVPFIQPAVQAKPKKRTKDMVCNNDYCELE